MRSWGRLGLALTLVIVLAGGVLAAEAPSGTIVEINGEPLASNAFYEQLEAQYGIQVLVDMVQEILLKQELQRQGLEITPNDNQLAMRVLRRQYGNMSDEQFQFALMQMMQQSPASFDRFMRLQAMVWKLTTKDVTVTDAEISEYFEANKDKYATPAQVKASHILVDNEEKALELVGEIEAGADFAELAKANSTCPSKDEGGDLGFFTKDDMVAPFSEAAFALAVGEYTKEPVKTNFGYHIIKVTDRKEAEEAVLADHKEDIKFELVAQKAANPQELIQGLFESAKFEVKWPRYQGFFSQFAPPAAEEITQEAEPTATE